MDMRHAASSDIGFDSVRFHEDLMKAARELGVKYQRDVAAEVGIERSCINRLGRGLSPSIATCLALCDWSGLNPLAYLIRPQQQQGNPQ